VPFTPFHLGPALFFGLALSVAFYLPSLLVASVTPDVEPFYVMYFRVSGYPLHGFFTLIWVLLSWLFWSLSLFICLGVC